MSVRNDLELSLKNAFPDGKIECVDLVGDENHWQVTIEDKSFFGKTLINQHRLVQDSIKHLDIHAVSIKTIISKE